MKFKIADGREHFYQWDLNRQVVVLDPTIEEVHFSNKSEKEALVVNVVDGLANVPNILLQQCFNIRVYAVEDDVTLYETVFELIARPKPSNYVYEETEIKSYEYLENKLNEIEEKGFSEETVGNAVESYLDEKLDLDGYATKDYVDDAISNIEISGIDLSKYALKTDIPDVSDFISEIPSEYITESELASKGYLTEHQDISHLATKEEVGGKLDKLSPTKDGGVYASFASSGATFLHKYSTNSDANTLVKRNASGNIIASDPTADNHVTTKKYVDDSISNINISETDLSEYAKKTDIPDVSDFISEIPSEYITESELEGKGYLTQHQSLDHLALKEHEHEQYLTEHQDLSHLALKEHTHSQYLTEHQSLEHLALKEHKHDEYLTEHQSLEDYALKTDIPDVSEFIKEIPSEYITETELNNKGYLTEHQDISHLATKEEIPSLEGYATEAYVDNKVSESGGGSGIPTYTIEWAKSSDTATQELMTKIYTGLFDDSFVLKKDYNLVFIFSGKTYYVEFIKPASSTAQITNGVSMAFYILDVGTSASASSIYRGYCYKFYSTYISYSNFWKEDGTATYNYRLYDTLYINSLTSRISALETDVATIKAQLGIS